MRSQSKLADEFRDRIAAMYSLHRGEAMEAAARSVLAQLPTGPVFLVTTSVEGAAIAAVCCVLAQHADMSWELVSLGQPLPALPQGAVVAVEPIDPGAWWRDALAHRLPEATLVTPDPPQSA